MSLNSQLKFPTVGILSETPPEIKLAKLFCRRNY